MRRLPAVMLAVTLATTACGDTGSTTTEAAPTPTQPATTSAATEPTTTTVPPSTTTPATTQPPATEAPPPEGAAASYALTQVAFGDAGFVQITNIGTAPGDPGGHWLCQRPVYYEIPSIELAPGQSVWIAADGGDLQFVGAVVGVVDAAGRIGSLAAETGEVALYRSNDFSDPDAIVDYVEWGSSGHGRSSVAAEAGIWPAGTFVEIPTNTIAITAGSGGADSPTGWTPDIGV